jgi:hypothetical protein
MSMLCRYANKPSGTTCNGALRPPHKHASFVSVSGGNQWWQYIRSPVQCPWNISSGLLSDQARTSGMLDTHLICVCADGVSTTCNDKCDANGVCKGGACCAAEKESCSSANGCCNGLVCSTAGKCVPFACPSGADCGQCPADGLKLCIDAERDGQATCGDVTCDALCTATCGKPKAGGYSSNSCNNAGGGACWRCVACIGLQSGCIKPRQLQHGASPAIVYVTPAVA